MNEQAEDVRPFVIGAETLVTVVEFPGVVRGRWLRWAQEPGER